MTRRIAHLDMDAFFAAIEERDNPRWKGMPIAVGSDPQGGRGRGVISTANYAARGYGIRSALPITTAWRLAQEAQKAGKPPVIFLPTNGRRYGQASQHIMEVVQQFAPTVEQASVDEAYLDLSHYSSWRSATAACVRLKQAIFAAEQLTCSVGLAANKMVAKVASDFKKPDGLTVVVPRRAKAFLAPLSVRAIPGIGPKSQAALARKGLTTVGQVQELTEADLYQLMGEWGLDLYDQVRGIASAELVTAWTAKSIGEQETFDEDTLESGPIIARIRGMCRSVMQQLHHDGFIACERVVLTVRFADFATTTRSHTLKQPVYTWQELHVQMMRMLLPFFDRRENPTAKAIRLVGVRTEQLVSRVSG